MATCFCLNTQLWLTATGVSVGGYWLIKTQSYGHTTIPRHLRDIVVTEYGVADLRDKTDEDVIKQMLSVADSHFRFSLIMIKHFAGQKRKRIYKYVTANGHPFSGGHFFVSFDCLCRNS